MKERGRAHESAPASFMRHEAGPEEKEEEREDQLKNTKPREEEESGVEEREGGVSWDMSCSAVNASCGF